MKISGLIHCFRGLLAILTRLLLVRTYEQLDTDELNYELFGTRGIK